MNTTQFHQLADQLMQKIEHSLDHLSECGIIDYENDGNLLVLIFNNQSKIIINRQTPLHQIWLATQTTGYHFNYHNGTWLAHQSGEPLFQILSSCCSQQAGLTITFSE